MLLYVIHMLYICYTYVILMLYICYTYVIHMLYIWYTYVIHMLYIFYTYVIQMLYICYMFVMLGYVIHTPCGMGVRIQPTPALMRVVRGDYLRDMSYPLPPAHCMQGLLAYNGAYELG